ncbi:aminotransferase class V-fold PLP-dependent enzyme [Glaciecola sp. 1036]|uniref:aminotransferase class V-fold PLP-dependent enzyme n=1 Tax=Alteromonadaceae TaxID=72275 RepID=UPI003D064613
MRFQDHFSSPSGIYLLSHSVGPMTRAGLSANQAFLKSWTEYGGDAWPEWLNFIDRFRLQLSLLLNCNKSYICPQPSVSMAFTQWLSAACKSKPKKNKRVVMHQDAFPSMGFVVQGLAATYNLQLVLVKGPLNDTDVWQKELEHPYTFCCLLTHVHSMTGELCDVSRLSELCQELGIMSVVDIAQSVGIIDIDLDNWCVDAVVGSSVKWLSGGPGAGFLITDVTDQVNLFPDHIGWFSHQNPFEFDILHFDAAPDALRFWGGTPDVLPFAIAGASISIINAIGVNNLATKNKTFQAMFLNQLSNSKIDVNAIGGTICLPIKDEKTQACEQFLKDNRVRFDIRDAKLRLSFGAVCSTKDVLLVADLVTPYCK